MKPPQTGYSNFFRLLRDRLLRDRLAIAEPIATRALHVFTILFPSSFWPRPHLTSKLRSNGVMKTTFALILVLAVASYRRRYRES